MANKALFVLTSALCLALSHGVRAEGQVRDAHAGTRKGAVYEATPANDAAAAADHNSAVATSAGATRGPMMIDSTAGSSAPVEPGAGVEIISGGGGGSDGAAKVGHLPVLQ